MPYNENAYAGGKKTLGLFLFFLWGEGVNPPFPEEKRDKEGVFPGLFRGSAFFITGGLFLKGGGQECIKGRLLIKGKKRFLLLFSLSFTDFPSFLREGRGAWTPWENGKERGDGGGGKGEVLSSVFFFLLKTIGPLGKKEKGELLSRFFPVPSDKKEKGGR